jgi:CheY-like chemotaxis protein/predicted regulator of Ras-like GTPase activity (Roadblock/LC7/MglB family)
MKARQRILIVDDETKVAFFLQESLEALGHDFEVIGVSSTVEALQAAHRTKFDLLVTDQRMPGMDGLELIRRVQKLHPDMQSILITAYGSEDTLSQAKKIGAFRYFTKPFHIEDFVQTVLEALNEPGRRSLSEFLPDQPVDMLTTQLEELRREVGAQSVVACDGTGTVLAQVGILSGIDLDSLFPFAADSFVASAQVAHLLGGAQTGNLIFHEGVSHDVYLAGVHADLFLAIIFDRLIQASRIGIVWLYTRRAIENLRRIRSPEFVRVGLD